MLRVFETWFSGSSETVVKTRHQVAEALKAVLAMEHNIAPAELRYAHNNISLCNLGGARPIEDAIVVFDNVSGGLRLSAPLFASFETILDRLDRAAALAGNEALLPQATVDRLREWHAKLDRTRLHEVEAPSLTEGEILVFAPESEVSIRVRGVLEERRLIEPQFLSMGNIDVLMYRYESAPNVHAWVAHDQVQAIGNNWGQVIWNPSTNQFRPVDA